MRAYFDVQIVDASRVGERGYVVVIDGMPKHNAPRLGDELHGVDLAGAPHTWTIVGAGHYNDLQETPTGDYLVSPCVEPRRGAATLERPL